MSEKVIIRSSTIDRHGDYVPLKQMKQFVDSVNGEFKMRYLVNHRRDLPPVGYFDHGEILKRDNVYHLMVEPINFLERKNIDWNSDLIIENPISPIAFSQRDSDEQTQLRISLDKNNFENFDAFNHTGGMLHSHFSGEITLEAGLRKGLLPDPQIVITLAEYGIIFYPLLKPFLTKIGDKIADDIGDGLYELAKDKVKKLVPKLSEAVGLVRKNMVPKNKALHVIFEISGDPYIELHIRSDDHSKLIKALSPAKLFKMHQDVRNLQGKLDITEIHFLLNAKNKWDFTYLITKQGAVLGTRTVFGKRDKLVQRINLSPEKAFSLGIGGVQFEKVSVGPKDSEP